MRKLFTLNLMKKNPTQFYFWLFITAFTVSTVLFTLPGDEFPSANWLNIPHLDKLVHTCIFVTLCYTCFLFIKSWKNPKNIGSIAAIIAALFLLYGVGIEFIQEAFVVHRSFELADIVADGCGCLVFLTGYLLTAYRKVE